MGLSKRPKSGYLYQSVVAASCTHLEVVLGWSLVFNSIEKLIFPSLLDEFGWIRARVGYSLGTTVAITEYFSIDSSALNRLKVPNRKDSRWRRRRRRLRRRKGVVCEAVYNVSDINTLRCPGVFLLSYHLFKLRPNFGAKQSVFVFVSQLVIILLTDTLESQMTLSSQKVERLQLSPFTHQSIQWAHQLAGSKSKS